MILKRMLFNESYYFNENDWGFENGDLSGGHCFMNYYTLYEAKYHNFIDSAKQRGGNVPNVSEM